MGLGGSALRYEGYGRTQEESVLALDAIVRFHHNEACVKRQTVVGESGSRRFRYFVWDGTQEHKIYYERSRGYIRAFIY
jgi:hypothetical protein